MGPALFYPVKVTQTKGQRRTPDESAASSGQSFCQSFIRPPRHPPRTLKSYPGRASTAFLLDTVSKPRREAILSGSNLPGHLPTEEVSPPLKRGEEHDQSISKAR